jgi:hypothetical protein
MGHGVKLWEVRLTLFDTPPKSRRGKETRKGQQFLDWVMWVTSALSKYNRIKFFGL